MEKHEKKKYAGKQPFPPPKKKELTQLYILLSDKIDFKAKGFTRVKEGVYYFKFQFRRYNKAMIKVEDFNTRLVFIDRSSR